jgi:hypothetical protein
VIIFFSAMLCSLWEELKAADRPISNICETSIPHAMAKLLMQLSVTPSQAGKQSDVTDMLIEDLTSDEADESDTDVSLEGGGGDDELEYALVEEDRRLWMEDFGDCGSDSDDDESVGEGDGYSSNNNKSPIVFDDDRDNPITPLADSLLGTHHQEQHQECGFMDPFFQPDGGDLPYGGHISIYSRQNATQYPCQGTHTPASSTTPATSGGGGYSTALVSPLPLTLACPTTTTTTESSACICQESDVCTMVTDMLMGNSSDFFALTAIASSGPVAPSTGAAGFTHPLHTSKKVFSLTLTASHSRLVHMSSVTLSHFLCFFTTLATHVQMVRNYVLVDFAVLRREHALRQQEAAMKRSTQQQTLSQVHSPFSSPGDVDMPSTKTPIMQGEEEEEGCSTRYHPTVFSEHMQSSVQQVLRTLVDQFQTQVAGWQRTVMMTSMNMNMDQPLHSGPASARGCNGCDEEAPATVTLVRLHVMLRGWVKVFQSASRLTNCVLRLDFTDGASSGASSGINQMSPELCQHEQVAAMLTQLQCESDVLHLLHCHPQLALIAPSPTTTDDRYNYDSSTATTADDDDDSYADSDGQFSSPLKLNLKICNPQIEVNFIRNCCFSLQSEYLNLLVNWLHAGGGGGGGKNKNKGMFGSDFVGGFGGLFATGNSNSDILMH